jgi:hypothetical protein
MICEILLSLVSSHLPSPQISFTSLPFMEYRSHTDLLVVPT